MSEQHTVYIEVAILLKVEYIESHFDVGPRVGHLEVEPLVLTRGAEIGTQNEVVLVFSNLCTYPHINYLISALLIRKL